MNTLVGLSPRQRSIVAETLRPFGHRIDKAGLFGSGATGRARAASDVDLVLYGPLTAAELSSVRGEFDDSDLELSVDVVAYDLIDHLGLKAHIDAVMVPLFIGEELRAAA